MKLIGLTGGVGMGKSTAANILSELGHPVIDTDQLARDLVEPGQPALEELKAKFGDAVIRADGRVNREALARIVFADPAARRDLEAILHPRIRAIWIRGAEDWRQEGIGLGIVVIPLLFETASEEHFDAVWCVACTGASQKARLAQRGWNADEISRRIGAQWPIEKKMLHASRIIWTEGTVDVHRQQISRLLDAGRNDGC